MYLGEVDIRGFLLFSKQQNTADQQRFKPTSFTMALIHSTSTVADAVRVVDKLALKNQPPNPALETHLFRFVNYHLLHRGFPNMLFWGTNLQPCNGMTMQHEFVLSQNLLLSATHATLFFIN